MVEVDTFKSADALDIVTGCKVSQQDLLPGGTSDAADPLLFGSVSLLSHVVEGGVLL